MLYICKKNKTMSRQKIHKTRTQKFGSNQKSKYILIRFEDDILNFMRDKKKNTSVDFRHMANEGMKLYMQQEIA